MVLFASDNVSCACPEVLEAVVSANSGDSAPYGDDDWSSALRRTLSEVFETDVAVFPTITGTAANALALSALTPSYGTVYCHELSHINTDECGAPELFTGGAKLVALRGNDGRISAEDLAGAIRGSGDVHHAQPSAASVTQACETGMVYPLDEVRAVADVARSHGLGVHMDGARLANAVAALEASPAEATWRSGVDVLSFGGTKNGCLMAEAVVFFDRDLAASFPYLHKRAGQLLSKMRFVSAQLNAYVSDDVWLRNARHANRMARRLGAGLSAVPGVELAYPTQSNEVFVRLPRAILNHLRSEGFEVNEFEMDATAARFVTAWNTDEADVERLLAAAASAPKD